MISVEVFEYYEPKEVRELEAYIKELEEEVKTLKETLYSTSLDRMNLRDQNKVLREALENIEKKYVIQNQTELYREQVADIYFIASNALSKTGKE